MFVSICSWDHHIKERHILNVLELIDFDIPRFPCLRASAVLRSNVIVVIENGELVWELSCLVAVFYNCVEVVFTAFVKSTT